MNQENEHGDNAQSSQESEAYYKNDEMSFISSAT